MSEALQVTNKMSRVDGHLSKMITGGRLARCASSLESAAHRTASGRMRRRAADPDGGDGCRHRHGGESDLAAATGIRLGRVNRGKRPPPPEGKPELELFTASEQRLRVWRVQMAPKPQRAVLRSGSLQRDPGSGKKRPRPNAVAVRFSCRPSHDEPRLRTSRVHQYLPRPSDSACAPSGTRGQPDLRPPVHHRARLSCSTPDPHPTEAGRQQPLRSQPCLSPGAQSSPRRRDVRK